MFSYSIRKKKSHNGKKILTIFIIACHKMLTFPPGELPAGSVGIVATMAIYRHVVSETINFCFSSFTRRLRRMSFSYVVLPHHD